jgi:hypothetical protein
MFQLLHSLLVRILLSLLSLWKLSQAVILGGLCSASAYSNLGRDIDYPE